MAIDAGRRAESPPPKQLRLTRLNQGRFPLEMASLIGRSSKKVQTNIVIPTRVIWLIAHRNHQEGLMRLLYVLDGGSTQLLLRYHDFHPTSQCP